MRIGVKPGQWGWRWHELVAGWRAALVRTPDDAMLRFHEGRTKEDPELDAKKAWRPVTPGLRDWRTEMPREQVERFEAAAGGLLDDLGYERLTHPPNQAAARVASRVRHSFLREIGLRGESVPRAWHL